MAAQPPQTNDANKLTKIDSKRLIIGIDMNIASLSRMNNKEPNQEIKSIREREIEQLVILKNRLTTKELEL